MKLGQVGGADQHCGRSAVAGDNHSLVVALDPVDYLAEVVPDRAPRLGAHSS